MAPVTSTAIVDEIGLCTLPVTSPVTGPVNAPTMLVFIVGLEIALLMVMPGLITGKPYIEGLGTKALSALTVAITRLPYCNCKML